MGIEVKGREREREGERGLNRDECMQMKMYRLGLGEHSILCGCLDFSCLLLHLLFVAPYYIIYTYLNTYLHRYITNMYGLVRNKGKELENLNLFKI